MATHNFYQIINLNGAQSSVFDVIKGESKSVKIAEIDDKYILSSSSNPDQLYEIIIGFLPENYHLTGFYKEEHIPYVAKIDDERVLMNAMDKCAELPNKEHFKEKRFFKTEVIGNKMDAK